MRVPLVRDANIVSMTPLPVPNAIMDQIPVPVGVHEFVAHSRRQVSDIIEGKDKRILLIIGPCSIHNVREAVRYGELLAALVERVKSHAMLVMRVYLEKPRTTVGWKGLMYDPDLDGSGDIHKGLVESRELLTRLSVMGVPCGCEFLDTILPQYISDLVCWGCIGARTSESQLHRQLASGMSMPIGFKNGTSGSVISSLQSIIAASRPHSFPGMSMDGSPVICSTRGNAACHLILRGGSEGPNYTKKCIDDVIACHTKYTESENSELCIVVDCSHGNSGKDHRRQRVAFADVMRQIQSHRDANTTCPIRGLMLESYLKEGRQNHTGDEPLEPMISITDSCIGWAETEQLVTSILGHAHKVDCSGVVSV